MNPRIAACQILHLQTRQIRRGKDTEDLGEMKYGHDNGGVGEGVAGIEGGDPFSFSCFSPHLSWISSIQGSKFLGVLEKERKKGVFSFLVLQVS